MTGPELADRIGYPFDEQPAGRSLSSVLWRGARGMATSRAGSWLLARSLRRLDRVAEAVLPGDRTATEVLAGLPVVILTTTGARTGRPRSVRLVPVVTADVFAVLGTNFGERGSPSWALNLLHDPAAVLEYRGRRLEVRACELDGRSRDDVVAAATRLYPGFARYVRRASGRRVHVFALVG